MLIAWSNATGGNVALLGRARSEPTLVVADRPDRLEAWQNLASIAVGLGRADDEVVALKAWVRARPVRRLRRRSPGRAERACDRARAIHRMTLELNTRARGSPGRCSSIAERTVLAEPEIWHDCAMSDIVRSDMAHEREPLVTVAIPAGGRLDYLPAAIESVAAQTHGNIEFIVSDNGGFGERLADLVAEHYPKPCTIIEQPSRLEVTAHFNDLLRRATGDYFVLLCDDDVISRRFVSDLVSLMEAHPRAQVAVPMNEKIDADGRVSTPVTSDRSFPAVMDWHDYLEARRLDLWGLHSSSITTLMRTAAARSVGGYPAYPRSSYSDEALLVRMAAKGSLVCLGHDAVFSWRIHSSSTGSSSDFRRCEPPVTASGSSSRRPGPRGRPTVAGGSVVAPASAPVAARR